MRDLIAIALRNRRINYDDPNHTANPFITLNLESGYRVYYLDKDGDSNIILSINKLMVADASGVFKEIKRVNQQTDTDMDSFWDGKNTPGTPKRFDQTGMAIFLDPIPDYSYTGGIKAFIDRNPSFFISTDTTKSAGTDDLVQAYLYLKPSYEYCRDKGRSNAEQLFRDMNIAYKYAETRLLSAPKDLPRRITPVVHNCR